MVSCRCFSIQCSNHLIYLLFLYPCYVRSNTLFINIFKIQINHSLRLSEPLFVMVFQIWWTITSPMPFFGSILPIFAYCLLYIMCISSKRQTVFWAQNFRDVQLMPNFLRYPACFWYCSFWKASLATNCLIDGFSYSNNILQNFYKENCCMKWD